MKNYLDWILETSVNEYWETNSSDKRNCVVSCVYCEDGTTLSVQASDGHYCQPRENYSGWYEVEVGFPSKTPSNEWKQYFDGEWYDNVWQRFCQKDLKQNIFIIKNFCKDRKFYDTNEKYFLHIYTQILRMIRQFFTPIGCDSVYGYIPVELVRKYIGEHGGEDTEKCWNKYNESFVRKY